MRTSFDFTSGKMVKENNNVTTMRNPITGNNIQLLPRANSHDTAMSNGRGMTSAIQYFDEFDFMPWNTTTLESSAFAYSTARENAINHGNVSLRLFSSTPKINRKNRKWAAIWRHIVSIPRELSGNSR